MSDWVVVVDTDHELCRRQIDAIQQIQPDPMLQGRIDCSDDANTFSQLCRDVTHFPAFCNVPTKTCVYGMRDTAESLQELHDLKTK